MQTDETARGRERTGTRQTAERRVATGTLHDAYNPLYNGNIAHTVNALQPWGGWTSPTQPAQVLAQVYRYDQLNRLKRARGVAGLTSANTWDGVTDATADRYKSQYTYDANGNIETVQRFDEAGAQYDDLQYHYEKSGTQLLRNRLYHLNESINGGYGDIGTDASTFHGAHADVNALNNYKYDELGNLIADKREEIANIEWTVSGKVKHITRTAGSTKPELWFTYGADGQRISKTVGDPLNGGFREYYLRDAQGNIMATYKYADNGTSLKVTERPVYGSSRIGSYTRQLELMGEPVIHQWPYTQPMQAPLKRYELTDHLGNVNTVVTGRLLPLLGPGVQYQAEVVSAQGYEAFGSLLPGRNYSSSSYRFGFQGQEKDDEVYGATGTSYAFKYRMHDARVGRFWSIDPLAAKYPHNSPYAFSENRVIDSNELEGLESIPGGQIVTSDDLLAPALLTTATDATVTPLTLWDTQVRYPEGGPARPTGVLTEGVILGAVFIHDKAVSTVSNVLLTTTSLLSGLEIGVRYGAADIHQDFTDKKVYPSEPFIIPLSLNESGTAVVPRKEIMDWTLTPTEGAEILGGAGSIVAPLVPAPTAVKMAVQGAVTGGLKALDD